MYLISKESNAYRLQKPLVLLAFYLNPIRIIVPKIPDTHPGIWNFLYTEGLERFKCGADERRRRELDRGEP